jgi:DNA-directed RNA polymerase subunit RPC12/RpoP
VKFAIEKQEPLPLNDQAEYYSEEDEPLEAYCVRCKETIEIENPKPVWTRRGMPATRGECPNCGGTVFRMGRTNAHSGERPAAVHVATSSRAKLAQDTAYVNFAEADAALAEQLADDLRKAGIAVWLHEDDGTQWAGGVHPALTECSRMVFVLSPEGLAAESVEAAWQFFKSKGKRIVIAQLAPVDPPDAIRRSPRFNFTGDYKSAFRQMIQALSG